MKASNAERVGEILRYIRSEFGDAVEFVIVDPRAWILSLFDIFRYNVKANIPVWILDGKKFFDGIPTKEQIQEALSKQ